MYSSDKAYVFNAKQTSFVLNCVSEDYCGWNRRRGLKTEDESLCTARSQSPYGAKRLVIKPLTNFGLSLSLSHIRKSQTEAPDVNCQPSEDLSYLFAPPPFSPTNYK